MDGILSAARTYIVNNGMSEVSIPDIEAYFSKEVSFTQNMLNICNYDGKYYKAITTFLIFLSRSCGSRGTEVSQQVAVTSVTWPLSLEQETSAWITTPTLEASKCSAVWDCLIFM